MQVTFLIGNGFDVSAGLSTQPVQFLSGFITEHESDNDADVVAARNLAATIKSEGVRNWADFEIKLGEYSDSVSTAEEYLEASDSLAGYLHAWLQAESARIDDGYIEANTQNCMGSLPGIRSIFEPEENDMIEKLRSRHSSEHWEYALISFNYTDTLFRMFDATVSNSNNIGRVDTAGRSDLLQSFNYAHGNLDGVIVTGVNDANQITNEAIRGSEDVQNNLIKSSIQRQLASHDDVAAFDIIARSQLICVFGMSLGMSDRRWWEAIYAHLTNNPETILVIFSYELGKEVIHTPYSRYRIISRIKRDFFDAAGVDYEPELSSRIIVAASNKILSIDEPLKSEADDS